VKSNSRNARQGNYFPDGLDETAIGSLIADVARTVTESPEPTTALMDGSSAERRRRRMERRTLAAVVRSLPVREVASQPVGEVA
jgi:hypothetical protein